MEWDRLEQRITYLLPATEWAWHYSFDSSHCCSHGMAVAHPHGHPHAHVHAHAHAHMHAHASEEECVPPLCIRQVT